MDQHRLANNPPPRCPPPAAAGGTEFHRALEAARHAPGPPADRVAELRRQVASGAFDYPLEALADRLLRHLPARR